MFDIFEAYGLKCRVNKPTHDRNGLLDVVATRNDIAVLEVDVIDVGFSDHRLVRWIRWMSNLAKPPPVYTTSTYRSWRRIDVTSFQEALWSSALCTADDDGDVDSEQLATLYDDVIVSCQSKL